MTAGESVAGDPGADTPDVWVTGGLEILAEDGIDAVRVERIAKRLGVSKGPFYWRYPDRPALLRAILDHWRAERTRRLIDETAAEPSPRRRLETLVSLALRERYGSIDVAHLEGAFRAWAAHDELAATAVKEVDAERLRHLEQELGLLGAGPAEQADLALAIYTALLGLYTLRRYTPGLAADQAYLALVKLALDAAERGASAGRR